MEKIFFFAGVGGCRDPKKAENLDSVFTYSLYSRKWDYFPIDSKIQAISGPRFRGVATKQPERIVTFGGDNFEEVYALDMENQYSKTWEII